MKQDTHYMPDEFHTLCGRSNMRFALIALLLVACGDNRDPDFVTKNKVAFYLNGHPRAMTQEQAEAYEAFAADIWMARYGNASHKQFMDCLNGAWVEMHQIGSSVCTLGTMNETCDGSYAGFSVDLVEYECPFDTSYAHELIHLCQWRAWAGIDSNHTDPIWTILRDRQVAFRVSQCTAFYTPPDAGFASPEDNP